MAQLGKRFRCEACGTEVLCTKAAEGNPVCCEKEMVLLNENTVDAALEKHVPVITKIDGGYKVTVGSVAHPMEEKHLIEWIELIAGDTVLRRYLKPNDAPEAVFTTAAEKVFAREHCNLHGLWKS